MWQSVTKYLFNNRIYRNGMQKLLAGQKALCHPAQQVPFQGSRQHTPAAFNISMPISAIEKVETFDKQRCITVHWEDGNHSQYPYVWLRDNCQCPQCFLHSAKARKLPIQDLDMNISAEKVILTDSKISVVWPDQHISEFDSNWLKTRSFAQSRREEKQEQLFLTDRQYWGSDLQIPTASFKEVLDNDEVAYQWLKTLRRIGVVRLKHAPTEKGQVAKLGKRIGYLRLTFYGHTWQVEDKSDANNVAYTSGNLSLHTDYPALHHPPGIQLLHSIKPAEVGGETKIVDGFHVANQLRQLNPEAFRILTSVLVNFTDSGVDYCDFSLQSKHKIIDLDHNGKVVQINFNNATRDSVIDLPVELVHPFLSALKDYVDLMYKPENLIIFKMEAGDVLTFDNWRILHGRQSYTSTGGSARHLEGAYANWDEAMSRLRCLEQEMNGNK
ncbi:gamma-butyrobetaine dioxygenase [Heterodontus francisci]|uniref:gamma-butyrobetaine dioxygenase n=1 Tax=Heterodontus francisci TaxID=7792 RepID=UPI00355C3ADA